MADQKYDQEFFLALALKGKDAWNAWRRDPTNNNVRMTFAGVDFSVPPRDQINFEGFEFGDDANFSGCDWRGAPFLALFKGAAFGHNANFTNAKFGINTKFIGVTFGQFAKFTGVSFGTYASFSYATFGLGAKFNNVSFGDYVTFTGAAFGLKTEFAPAHFKGRVLLPGVPKEELRAAIADLFDVDATALDELVFAGAQFDGEATFSSRSLVGAADFRRARFFYPPNFDDTFNPNRIDFTGARIGFVPRGKPFHWTSNTQVPLRLRALRKIAEETKNHDLERDLYIEQRKAERGVYLRQRWDELKDALKNGPKELNEKIEAIRKQQRGTLWKWCREAIAPINQMLGVIEKIVRLAIHGFWISVMFLYWALADYGRSFLLPVGWLALSGYAFYRLYLWILSPIMAKAVPPDIENYKHTVQMLAFGNTVPFVGPLTIDAEIKKFLFCLREKDCLVIPPHGYQWAVVGQNLLSIILVFFIGLALRNYFKIK
jgi:hypothetical protein